MVIITSHINLDFDGLASMIAAQKLHPQGIMVYSGKLNKNVNYFMSLHKDAIKILPSSEIDLNKVSKLIIVDTSSPKRTGKFSCLFENSRVEKIIYDHHNKIQAGATVTKLVEKIRNKNLSITPLEATVFALGIYEDTGFFRYSITTPRDLSMAAYLLEKGANLQVISEFLEYPLSEVQQSLLEELISNSIVINQNGINILLAWCETSHYVEGLANIASKLYDIRDCQVVILVVKMENRIFITARSKVDNLDLAGLLSQFNGGGHKRAAAAVVKNSSIESIISEIKRAIKKHIVPVKRARDIMSTPVKTIPPESSINEAYGVLIKYGHTGLPVVKNGKLVGIISRRDIEKAKHLGLGHAPVKGFMRRKVITISENATIYEIQELMINNNIGRLPVIEDGRLKGIVTRTDILRELHGSTIERNSPIKDLYIVNNNSKTDKINLKNTMKTKLNTKVFNFLVDIGKQADKANVELYVVGGFVRDLLLGIPNLDVDLVVVGDGVNFARQVAHHFNAQITVHKRFETASIHLKNEEFKVDISTARREFYEYPAALPKVERSSIKFDLYRRDFTINSMAISLNQGRFGDLIDYFSGKRDLEEKLIRVLHSLSFIEDPTRIFRAIRFEQRLDFNLEAETRKLAGEAIKDKAILELTPERIRDELMLIFQEPTAGKILYRLEEIGLFKNFFVDYKVNDVKKKKLIKLQSYLKTIEAKSNYFKKEFQPILYLSTLVYDLDRKEVATSLKKLKFPKSITRSVLLIHDNLNSVRTLNTEKALQPSQIYNTLKHLPVEALIWYSFFYKGRVEQRIAFYLEQLRGIKLIITGNDLKKLGIPPGAIYHTIKSKLINIKIDKGLKTKEEELKYAKKIYEEIGDDEGA